MSRLRTLIAAGLIGIVLTGLAGPVLAQAASPDTTAASETQALTRRGDAGLVREVRLALVCYGGSSLAIYIHGNAKELHRLVLASKALQIDALADSAAMQNSMADLTRTVKPPPGAQGQKLTGSTRVWYDRLMDVWFQDPKRVRTRVVVDVIAGTSAGGINGVILAKALAHDLSQDGLTELWMNKASLKRLTDNYLGFFRIFRGGAPINGDALANWLYEALDSMDRQAVGRTNNPSLLPSGDRLDLFVTTTDLYGYPQQVVINDPPLAAEKHFPHVLHFIYSGKNRGCAQRSGEGGMLDDFCPEWTPTMAFAARASSSIPGVFPPLSLGQTLARFESLTPPDKRIPNVAPSAPVDVVVNRLFRNFQLQEPDQKPTYATATYFVDGGVLDNHPFGPAIAEVLRRPQDQEVRRYLLYLQPDPGKPPAAPSGKKPGLLSTIKAGLSGIPSQQPILDELNDIADYNEKVRRIRDIVHSEEVATRAFEKLERAGHASGAGQTEASLTVAQRLGVAVGFSAENLEAELLQADQARLRGAREAVEEKADQGVTDFAGRSYYSLRVHSVLDQFVDVIASEPVNNYPPESAHRALVARIIARWAEKRGLIDDPTSPEEVDPMKQKDLQREFLKDFDVGYQRRQLRFATDWINQQYTAVPPPTREERKALDELKAAAAKRINQLTRLVAGKDPDPQLVGQLAALQRLFGTLSPWPRPDAKPLTIQALAEQFVADPANLAALDGARRDLGAALRRLQQDVRDGSFEDFKTLGGDLPPSKKKEILVRYFGFPFWDRQIYPLIAFSDLGELTEIRVVRMSPNDAVLLEGGPAEQKLVGARAAHFGAFLSRPGRESDYVWGRLDAAERLLTVLGIPNHGAGDLFRSIIDEVRTSEGKLIRESILNEREADIDKHFPR
jgi:patatin-related protein